jgi:tetratricopeptide (TPR) repeat protein
MNRNLLIFLHINIIVILTITGCFRWKSDFSTPFPSLPQTQAQILLEEANILADQAGDREKLIAAIEAYKKVLEADPNNYHALCYLSTYHLLLGDGYTSKKSHKVKSFKAALGYSERAMYTNPAFKELINEGASVWEAVDSLTIREMDAMLFWTTAVFYYYKEGLGVLGQIINYPWVNRARKVLERMTELDPDWGDGEVHFTWGVYYLSIPEVAGGDRDLSAEYFQKAIEANPRWLLNRWGRAKYFHVKMRNPQQFKEDLKWVLTQDIHKAAGPYAWNAYFTKDARTMLDNFEDYF